MALARLEGIEKMVVGVGAAALALNEFDGGRRVVRPTLQGLALAMALLLCMTFSGCTSRFSIDSLWKSANGTMISLNDGRASASLFGFNGGPDGSYQLSEGKSDGTYQLYGSHLTGGTVQYLVTVQDNSHIKLELQSKSTFAPKRLTLTRQ